MSFQRLALWLVLTGFSPLLLAQTPSGEEILKRLDQNMTAESKILTVKMVVYGHRTSRTITFKTRVRGEDGAFTEYLSPPSEKGVKMLKLEDQLWIYAPSTNRILKLSGLMLWQNVMGSDLSYEDVMVDFKLQDAYRARVVAAENHEGRQCWVVQLLARRKNLAYHSRRLWVDKERFLPLKEERFDKNDTLLKVVEIKEVMLVGERWMPRHVIYRDQRKEGKGTEYFLESVDLNVDIPPEVLSPENFGK